VHPINTTTVPVLTLELSNVRIVGMKALGPGSTTSVAMEEVGLAYGKVKWTYVSMSDQGAESSVTGGWDLTTGKPQ
jgi:type VI protein secretion system component Hcp